MAPELDYHTIRRRVEQDVKEERLKRNRFLLFSNIAFYLVFMALAWLVVPGVISDSLAVAPRGQGMIIIASLGWTLSTLVQSIALLNEGRQTEKIRQRLMVREIDRQTMRLGLDDGEPPEKRKHGLHLTDDGELHDMLGNEHESEQPAQQRTNTNRLG